jgi:hypothetical protein
MQLFGKKLMDCFGGLVIKIVDWFEMGFVGWFGYLGKMMKIIVKYVYFGV